MIQRSAPRHPLTIGMATYDDFDGLYFTITSLMLHHREVMESCDFVVIDNHPDSKAGKHAKEWIESNVPGGTYVAFRDATGTAQARDQIFQHATGDAVLCLDSHVLLDAGVVGKLIDYYASNPESRDLLTGPLLRDSGKIAATHQAEQWRSGAWGTWAIDDRGRDPEHEPFEIWQQGMGLFSCKRDAWVGFHPEFRGFGGCESYIMEKFRQRGGKVLCCPWMRWTHRFRRPAGVPYQVSRDDTFRNYMIGFSELGIDPQPAIEHYRELTGRLPGPARASSKVPSLHVVGHQRLGAVRMRGGTVANHYGCEISNGTTADAFTNRETILAVKSGFDPSVVRRRCDRLIYDPLDSFSADRRGLSAIDYWRRKYKQIRFDDILATSPACYELMLEALPDSVGVHLVPHHADPRINRNWADPDGPVVYSGLQQYVQSGWDKVQRACDKLGRELRSGPNMGVLKGASLALSLRLPPYSGELYRCCKPQVKIANAIAAGIPTVATSCPATTSLLSDLVTVEPDFEPHELANAMREALARGPLEVGGFELTDYLGAMDQILGVPRKVVFTAIFGGRDHLHEPRQRHPGVQYVCFTDNPRLKSKTWTIRYCPPTDDPLMQAKRIKVLAHEALDCDFSLWIDGKVDLSDLNGAFEWLDSDLAFQSHPVRNCLYEEAMHCKQVRKGDPSMIDRSVSRYSDAGHPRDYGLWYAGVILRRHNRATRRFNEQWWNEITSGTSRDQISLPVVIRGGAADVATMPSEIPNMRIDFHTAHTVAPSRVTV